MSQDPHEFDVAVVGGGSGGFAAARASGHGGLKTILIEGGKEVGGLCILRGCMPTKALLQVAELLHQIRHADRFGIRVGGAELDFATVMGRKDRLVEEFAAFRREQLRTGPFQFVRAWAQFTDPHRLVLSNGQTVHARQMVVATGSAVAPPALDSLKEVGYLSSDDALQLTALPKSIIILGGGAVAVEFAQFFARLGSEVTLIQRGSHVLHQFDSDGVAVIEQAFRRENIRVYTGTRLIEARRQGRLKEIIFENRGAVAQVAAEEIFVGLGRVPNTSSLQLDRAGVKTEGSRILTNAAMQSSVPHIYAVGDCRGRHQIVHLAVQQGEIAAHNILHPEQQRELDYRLLTMLIFTSPQIAQVGLTEKEAAAKSIPVVAAKYPFGDHGKALLMEERDGFVKLMADPVSGEILGGTAVGPFGGELIHEIIAAMAKRMTVHELAVLPHYHPTLAEIWTYPAGELSARIGRELSVGSGC